ncbi:MAG: SDR family oxidoreductase [Acidobacteriota bacterium]
MKLQGRVAVVTGGASGMGLASVLRFLDEGASVLVADYNAEAGAAFLEQAGRRGLADQVDFLRTDVASEPDVEAMCARAVERFGRLDVVFNNAGVGGAIGPLTETTVEDWDYTFDVLAKGVFLGIKHGARVLRRQGQGGCILNTASIAGLSGDGGPLAYSAAKAAVINMTRSAAVELAEDHIRVNAICPGFIVTPLAAVGNPEVEEDFQRAQPWPEAGQGDHIAGAAVFLASEDAAFVTGEALVVDGGLTAAGPEITKRFPKTSGRNLRVSGVTKGSTGEAPELRRLEET